jgi:hypothetical protein
MVIEGRSRGRRVKGTIRMAGAAANAIFVWACGMLGRETSSDSFLSWIQSAAERSVSLLCSPRVVGLVVEFAVDRAVTGSSKPSSGEQTSKKLSASEPPISKAKPVAGVE